MKNSIICTVGTSLLGNMRRNNIEGKDEILRKLSKTDETDRICGAEINSNYSIIKNNYINELKSIYFCVSNTDDGELVGEILSRYYENKYPQCQTEIRIVEKLQSNDYKAFKNHGLKNLVKNISDIISGLQNKGYEPVINATGGYKAQISFAGLIGQALKIPVYYQFEYFLDIIEMPPMPVSFDDVLWNTNYDVFDALYRKDLIETNKIDYSKLDERIRILIDEDEGNYILSPVGLLYHLSFLHRIYLQPQRPKSILEAERTGINISKAGHHLPEGVENYINKIYNENDYVKRISIFKLSSKNDSYFKSSTKITPENNNGEYCIEGYYSDGGFSCVFDIYTTATNEQEVSYVLTELSNKYIN